MNKIVWMLLLGLCGVWGIEEFKLEESHHDPLCQQFTTLLNKDLNDHGKIDLLQHPEFNWLKWKPIKTKLQEDKVYMSYFDINNDHKQEGIFLDKIQWHDNDIEAIWYMDNDKARDFEANLIPGKIHLLSNDTLKEGVPYSFGIYSFANKKEVTLLGKKTSQLNFVAFYPMKVEDVFYMAVFGNTEFFDERVIEKRADMQNEANGVVLLKVTPENKVQDLCYLARNHHKATSVPK